MHDHTSSTVATKPACLSPGAAELSTSPDQSLATSGHSSTQSLKGNAEQIMSAITHLTSSSIGELEGLTNELQKLQVFLTVETERVQRELDSVMAGVKVIIEAIAPWKDSSSNAGQNSASGQVPGARSDRVKR